MDSDPDPAELRQLAICPSAPVMPESPQTDQPVLSRVAGGAFFDRKAQFDKLWRAATGPLPRTMLLLGPPQSGRTELLRMTFDLLFNQAHQALPLYFQMRDEQAPPQLAHDFLLALLRQYLAFVNRRPDLINAADLSLSDLPALAGGDEQSVIQKLIDGYELRRQAGSETGLLRYVFSVPLRLAASTPHRLMLMLDEAQLLNQIVADGRSLALLDEMFQQPPGISVVVTGLRRALLEESTFGCDLIGDLWLDWMEPLDLPMRQALLIKWCGWMGVELDHETGRLAIQQTGGNLLYLRALVSAAAERKTGLASPIDFERLYVDELLRGRIAHYFSGLLRRLARLTALNSRSQRAATDIAELCYEALTARAPVEAVEQKLQPNFGAARLLAELHQHELITLLDDHILPSDDPVLRDWLKATHQRFAGMPVSQVTLDLLSRRLKAVPQMLSGGELRSLQKTALDLLARFDRQSIARSLMVQDEFLIRYGSATYGQIISGLQQEPERVTLPQIVYATEMPLVVHDDQTEESNLPPWSFAIAYGFDDGICDHDHETVWVLALNSSPTPVSEALAATLDQFAAEFSDPFGSGQAVPHIMRWAISKMGFTAEAGLALRERGFLTSDYLQLELLSETLEAAPRAARSSPVSVEVQRPDVTGALDLTIPIGDDREIIAARVAEQIARAAGFAPEEMNQLKTALIEACLSLSAADSSADGRLYQRFHTNHERMTITIASSATALDQPGGIVLRSSPSHYWRLDVLRSLVDEVTLTQLVGGLRVALTKIKSTS